MACTFHNNNNVLNNKFKYRILMHLLLNNLLYWHQQLHNTYYIYIQIVCHIATNLFCCTSTVNVCVRMSHSISYIMLPEGEAEDTPKYINQTDLQWNLSIVNSLDPTECSLYRGVHPRGSSRFPYPRFLFAFPLQNVTHGTNRNTKLTSQIPLIFRF